MSDQNESRQNTRASSLSGWYTEVSWEIGMESLGSKKQILHQCSKWKTYSVKFCSWLESVFLVAAATMGITVSIFVAGSRTHPCCWLVTAFTQPPVKTSLLPHAIYSRYWVKQKRENWLWRYMNVFKRKNEVWKLQWWRPEQRSSSTKSRCRWYILQERNLKLKQEAYPYLFWAQHANIQHARLNYVEEYCILQPTNKEHVDLNCRPIWAQGGNEGLQVTTSFSLKPRKAAASTTLTVE